MNKTTILNSKISSNFSFIKLDELLVKDAYSSFFENHQTDFYTLIIVTRGACMFSLDFKDLRISKGTIVAIRKNQIHKYCKKGSAEGYVLFFKEEFLNTYLNEDEVSKTIQMFNELLTSPITELNQKNFYNVGVLLSHIENEMLNVADNYSTKVIRSLLHILVTIIHRLKSQNHNKVQLKKYLKEFIRFQNLLEANCYKTKRVADYADKLGFSSKKLNMISQFIAHKSAKMFIDDVFVIKIKSLLLQSNLSIKEIAFQVGFKDPANFYKYFKKHTDYTPENFRKTYKF